MFLVYPGVSLRAKKCRSNRDGAAAGLFGPARHRLHDSAITAGTNLKTAFGQFAAQLARLFVIRFAGARPRTPENGDDGAFRGHAGNYFTERLVPALGPEGGRRWPAARAGRVPACGPRSSTIAKQIESTALAPSPPFVPVLLPKIEKTRWAPPRV